MKRPIILTALLSCLLLGACFDDEGNYDYQTLNAPIWKISDNELIRISCRAGEGEEVYFNGGDYYTWATDSLTRAAEVRYEWKINGVVFATDASVKMPTDEFIKKANITSFGTSGIPGSFAIIEKETDIVYMVSISVTIAKTHAVGDWIVLSEKQDGSKLSFIKRKLVQEGETYRLKHELKDNYYEEVNSDGIPGKPLSMAYTYGANNVSELGSLTVMTSQGAYEINPETFIKVQELKEDFAGNLPGNLNITDRQDAWGGPSGIGGLHSFVTTEDGRIFSKMMTKNNLGGHFMSTPYTIDNKGYKVTSFGSTKVGYTCIPCYDEKNRRLLVTLFQQSGDSQELFPGFEVPAGTQFMISKMYPVKQPPIPVSNVPDVENMPEDTEILQLGLCGQAYVGGFFGGTTYYFVGMVYNTQGKTMLGTCAVVGDKSNPGALGANAINTVREFPGGNLDKSSIIQFASWLGYGYYPQTVNNYMLYTKGHEVFCLDRSDNYANQFTITLEDNTDKITCMKWGVYNDYDELFIGTEKGNIYCYNNLSSLAPKLVTSFNVQGKVTDFKELYNYSYGTDRDNY